MPPKSLISVKFCKSYIDCADILKSSMGIRYKFAVYQSSNCLLTGTQAAEVINPFI